MRSTKPKSRFETLHDLTQPPRPIAVALARDFFMTPVDHPRLAVLNRIFGRLSGEDQLRCRAELLQCRHSKKDN